MKGMRTFHEARQEIEGLPHNENGCWVWQGGTSEGYGNLRVEGQPGRTHRWAYLMFVGPIPRGMCVLHACDNRLCCNPQHLTTGTRAQNMAEMYARERASTAEQRRTYGHRKLTEKDVTKIDRLSQEGWSQERIGEQFGVHQTAIGKVLRRESWQHIPRP